MIRDAKILVEKNITPAHEEYSVKSYQCTYYNSRILGVKAIGYLLLTNKRVIFQADGTSNVGRSVIQSEIPIEEVSGISSYKGAYFSIKHFLGVLFFVSFVNQILGLLLLALVILLKDENVFLAYLFGIPTLVASFFLPKKNIWRSVLAYIASSSLTIVSLSFFVTIGQDILDKLLSAEVLIIPGLCLLTTSIYALICCYWYALRPTFSLGVHAKSGSNTPINISGASGLSFLDAVAGRALNAEPLQDVEPMLSELGAIILDIQKLGDMGVEKWQDLPTSPTQRVV